MRGYLVLPCLLVAAIIQVPSLGQAADISLSLNLQFNALNDFNSGGTWKVVGKADARGIAGVSFRLADVDFIPATGFVGPTDFELRPIFPMSDHLNIFYGDHPGILPLTADVGVIGGPVPSSYVDSPQLKVFGGNPDLGSFTGGVELISGSFNPGVVPSWFSGNGGTGANSYISPTPSGIVPANVQLTVRYLVPEPTSVWLIVLIGGVVAAMRHSRQYRVSRSNIADG